MTRRMNSAQRDWAQNPDATWRRAFPLFSAGWDSAASLLGHEKLLLVLAAAALVALTFAGMLVLVRFEPNAVSHSWVQQGDSWTLAAVGLVGVWTSVGRGAWHFRFPLGVLAAAWIAVAHIAAVAAISLPRPSVTYPLMTLAVSTFSLCAFGGAWLRSLARWQLAGPGEPGQTSRLRLFQFSTASLFIMMMLAATVLGLWQIARDLEGLTVWQVNYLDSFEARIRVLVATGSVLSALAIAFGDWKTAVVACGVCLSTLGVSYYTNTPRGLSALQALEYSLDDGALVEIAVSFASALASLAVLRLVGFRRERIAGADDDRRRRLGIEPR